MSTYNPPANKPHGDVQESPIDQPVDERARETLEYAANGSHIDDLLAYLDGDELSIDADAIVRSLALLKGKLCLEVGHEGSTEFIWLTDEWDGLRSQLVRGDTPGRGPTPMDADDLQHRVDNETPMRVRLTDDVPVAGNEVPA